MSSLKIKINKFIDKIVENKHLNIFVSSFMTWSLLFLYVFVFTSLTDKSFIKNHPALTSYIMISGTIFVIWFRTKCAYEDGYLCGRIDVYKEIDKQKSKQKLEKEESKNDQKSSQNS